MTLMDKQVGELIDELKESGKADNTIIFYYGNHGGALPGASERLVDKLGLYTLQKFINSI